MRAPSDLFAGLRPSCRSPFKGCPECAESVRRHTITTTAIRVADNSLCPCISKWVLSLSQVLPLLFSISGFILLLILASLSEVIRYAVCSCLPRDSVTHSHEQEYSSTQVIKSRFSCIAICWYLCLIRWVGLEFQSKRTRPRGTKSKAGIVSSIFSWQKLLACVVATRSLTLKIYSSLDQIYWAGMTFRRESYLGGLWYAYLWPI